MNNQSDLKDLLFWAAIMAALAAWLISRWSTNG